MFECLHIFPYVNWWYPFAVLGSSLRFFFIYIQSGFLVSHIMQPKSLHLLIWLNFIYIVQPRIVLLHFMYLLFVNSFQLSLCSYRFWTVFVYLWVFLFKFIFILFYFMFIFGCISYPQCLLLNISMNILSTHLPFILCQNYIFFTFLTYIHTFFYIVKKIASAVMKNQAVKKVFYGY